MSEGKFRVVSEPVNHRSDVNEHVHRPYEEVSGISARVKGHGLARRDERFIEIGNTIMRLQACAPAGRAKCECGELSPVLWSAAERKAWHREHKANVRSSDV